jgi:hypothetical protein
MLIQYERIKNLLFKMILHGHKLKEILDLVMYCYTLETKKLKRKKTDIQYSRLKI